MNQPYQAAKIDQKSFQPKGIKKIEGKELRVTWSDQHESVYPFRLLRQECQCALCVDEWTRNPILAKDSVSADIQGLSVSLVGQYAITVSFSDGHATGIYAFNLLRGLCPCAACKAAKGQ